MITFDLGEFIAVFVIMEGQTETHDGYVGY